MTSAREVGRGNLGDRPPLPRIVDAAAPAAPPPKPTKVFVWRTKWRLTASHPRDWQSRIVLTLGDSLSDVRAQWPNPDDIVLFEPMCLGIADMPTTRAA